METPEEIKIKDGGDSWFGKAIAAGKNSVLELFVQKNAPDFEKFEREYLAKSECASRLRFYTERVAASELQLQSVKTQIDDAISADIPSSIFTHYRNNPNPTTGLLSVANQLLPYALLKTHAAAILEIAQKEHSGNVRVLADFRHENKKFVAEIESDQAAKPAAQNIEEIGA